ncbi:MULTISPECIES: extracellular solute-binding protein [unclassified Guyparkeria]|uniref:extracellular solute-binding protein n=1 Tax=unclassified Guyparkeria TaxID=2626246 RepID=UPI0009EABC36|nr:MULTISPECIES: extracellular solute-binding protein [unclassified Guyparkeria]
MTNKHPTTPHCPSVTDETADPPRGVNLLSPDRRLFLRRLAGLGGIAALGAWPGLSRAAGFAEALGYDPGYPADLSHFEYVNPRAPREGSLTLSVFGTFDSLNPFVLKGLAATGTNSLLFDTLVVRAWDEPFSVYGLLADRLELAEDGLSATFRVNADARFANGRPVTAHDVVFSFETLVGESAHPRYRYYWADVAGAEAVDARHVRFDFRRVNPELHMIIGELPVFSRDQLAEVDFAEYSRTPLPGSGPYEIEAINFGRDIRYRRRDDYWARDLGVAQGVHNFRTLGFKYYKDETVALEAFKAGEFDVFHETNSKRWARAYEGKPFAEGRIRRREIPHHNNAGMQGFAINTRRPLFADRRVRRALNLAFDFHWSNVHLFYGQYSRCDSYFSNSEMAATGVPQGRERELLEPFRDQLPPALFREPHVVPFAPDPEAQRANLVEAQQLLAEAGWDVVDGWLRDARGEPFRFEIMLAQRGFERIVAPFAYNLRRLGIDVSYRTIDVALYQRRMNAFDFDMTVISYGQSQSPGNELREFFGSASAGREGSRNYCGIEHPAVDAMIDEVIYAEDREALVTACRALDRVLMWNEYLIPNWYIGAHRMAWWNRFGYHDDPLPRYFSAAEWVMSSWWETHAEAQPGPVVNDVSHLDGGKA